MEMLSQQRIVAIGGSGSIAGAFLAAASSRGAECISMGRTAPAGYRHFQADVTNLEEMSAVVDALFAEAGTVDTVINFAGVHHAPMDFTHSDHQVLLAEFRRVVEVNLVGAFIATMVFARQFVRRRHGHLIHLGSNASRLSLYGSHGYTASKHGLEGLVKSSAAQRAPFGVRVNGVAPGTVETPLNRHLLRDESGRYSRRAASILAHTPTKRFATLDGISETLVSLCLPQRHLTGNMIFCDDGYNIEGHSWPQGSDAVYGEPGDIDRLYDALEQEFPRE
jgi:NAD(P)-dependent dehydrogenase (short-subunit alcohol dehydrogenase family)